MCAKSCDVWPLQGSNWGCDRIGTREMGNYIFAEAFGFGTNESDYNGDGDACAMMGTLPRFHTPSPYGPTALAPAPLVAPTLPRAASDALPRCNMAAEFMFDPDNDFSMGKGEGKGEGEGNMMPSEDDMIAFAPIIEYLCPSSRRKLSAASPSLKAATLKLRRALQAKLKKLMKAAARK